MLVKIQCVNQTNRCINLHLVPSWRYHFKVVIPLCTLPVPRRPGVYPYQTVGLLTDPIQTHRQTIRARFSRKLRPKYLIFLHYPARYHTIIVSITRIQPDHLVPKALVTRPITSYPSSGKSQCIRPGPVPNWKRNHRIPYYILADVYDPDIRIYLRNIRDRSYGDVRWKRMKARGIQIV